MAVLPPRPYIINQNLVWDVNTLMWIAMQQPILNAGTIIIGGTVDVSDRANRDLGKVDIAGLDQYTPGSSSSAASLPVVIANDQQSVSVSILESTTIPCNISDIAGSPLTSAVLPVKEKRATITVVTSVADSAINVTLLASNVNRLGATIYNDSTVNLFVKLGATASLTSYTVRLIPNAYFEVPYGYTGIIEGIWASDAAGSARITELL